jgi:hypothetical protein
MSKGQKSVAIQTGSIDLDNAITLLNDDRIEVENPTDYPKVPEVGRIDLLIAGGRGVIHAIVMGEMNEAGICVLRCVEEVEN